MLGMQLSLWQVDAPHGETARPRTRHITISQGDELAQRALRERLAARAQRFEDNAHAQRTRDSYQADWDAFESWCAAQGRAALPASVETLRLYLTQLADRGLKVSTIRHARKSIGLAHGHAGVPRPDRDARIRALERGMGRELGTREEGVDALLEHELARAVGTLRDSPRDDRDRAVLLIGFAGAFRAGELAGLDLDSYQPTPAGVRIFVRRSKDDPLGRGAHVDIPRGTSPDTCPVEALRIWVGRVGRPSGPLFRVVYGAQIEPQRMSARAVARAVQRLTERAGIEGRFGAHSLRSGLATSASARGCTTREIAVHGRWRDERSVGRYIQEARITNRRNVAEGLL